MPLDDRLRAGLARNAATFEPDEDTAFTLVTHPRRSTGRATRTVLIAAAAVAFVVTLGVLQRPNQPQAPSSAPISTPPTLTGRYWTIVAESETVPAYDIAGRWEIRLDPSGILDVRPPPAYTGVVTAQLFQSTPEEFRTDLFGTDLCSGHLPGMYRWNRNDKTLTFSVVDDLCAARVMILTDRLWTEGP
jgi:hypothetical protein